MQEQAKQAPDYVPARDEKGRLLPGHTANPHGRPKHSQDAYNKRTLKALSKFVDNPERMAQMLQECWEVDKIRTMGMVLHARTKDVRFDVDELKTVVIDFQGYDEDAFDGELIEDVELIEEEPRALQSGWQGIVGGYDSDEPM